MNMFSPAEIAKNYVTVGKAKANLPISKMIMLGILAGFFISCGGVTSTAVGVSVPYPSLAKFIGACCFPGGLTMVLLAGSELFTGNCLLSIPLLQKEITWGGMLKNWLFVYLGNFIGSILVAAAVVYSHTLSLFSNELAVSTISTAVAKTNIGYGDALIRGILCNFLVCIAVWIAFAAKDVVGKIVGLFFPVMMFVACGFEHSVANMYFVTVGLFAKLVPAYAEAATAAGLDLSNLTLANLFTHSLIPVTIGNIIGGSICVGWAYWFCYLRKQK